MSILKSKFGVTKEGKGSYEIYIKEYKWFRGVVY